MFPFRPSYYRESGEPENDILEINIAKNRLGPTGTVITGLNLVTKQWYNVEASEVGATSTGFSDEELQSFLS
jgi:replicative DNA helicase